MQEMPFSGGGSVDFLRRLFGKKEITLERHESVVDPPEVPDFPFELILVRGIDALGELERLENVGAIEGFSPLIIGEFEHFGAFRDSCMSLEKPFDQVMEASNEISADAILKSRIESDPEYYDINNTTGYRMIRTQMKLYR